MSFSRTDKAKLQWPKGTLAKNRILSRKIIESIDIYDNVVIACSGGLDSTVLSHAYSKSCLIKGVTSNVTLLYVNHNLRSQEEIDADICHVKNLANSLNFNFQVESVTLSDGNVQAQAREARYNALSLFAGKGAATVLLAHHANDVAETKLFQFLTGRPVSGIGSELTTNGATFKRPILEFFRDDLEIYAKTWNLSWSEDSSNSKLKYTRNKIRHELIPWIEKNINPSIVKILSSD